MTSNISNVLLSEITAFRTYSKYLKYHSRRETLDETINRSMSMHLDRFPRISKDIVKAFQRVHDRKVVGSMRGMQFAGDAILKNNARIFNCSYAPIEDVRVFSEGLFLLLSGVGFGYSVQKHHINKLPKVKVPREEGIYIIHDSIQGWAEALNVLLEAYFNAKIRPHFDYSLIRLKGSYLVTTGAKAPGPDALRAMLTAVEAKLKLAIGRQLRSLEVHDIMCLVSEAVLAGGIRRAALISLFDADDQEMLLCKSGNWWEKHPYRARANNSANLHRKRTSKKQFMEIFEICERSGAGEPGIKWTNDDDLNLGSNPCVSGDTEILTDDGYKRIDELVDQRTTIWNGFEWSEVIPKITGKNQDMLTVSFSDGRSLTCTKYHKFHISTDYFGNSSIIEAKDLEPGMKLIKHKFPIIEHGPTLKHAYTQGFVSAEGMELNTTLYVYPPKDMCLSRLEGVKSIKEEPNNKRKRLVLKETPVSKKMVPIKYDLKSKLEWLAGLFDGDGTELKEGGLQLVSVNRIFLKELQTLLSTVGVQSKILFGMAARRIFMPDGRGGQKEYDCQESYRVCIGAKQMQLLKSLGLKCERMSFDKTPQRDASQFVTVVDATESGVEEIVYCFNEPKKHMGIFNGILTGQCNEISLKPYQFCNLTSISQTGIKDTRDFMNRVYAATLIGTLQASYTDFHYLSDRWKNVTEEEALLGVSFTGIADGAGLSAEDLQAGATFALEVNEKYANKIGTNLSARTTTVKPEGSSSCVLASSSGIHARHAEYYIRRIRMNKDDALTNYLRATIPDLVEDDKFSSNGSVVSLPQESPKGSIIRHNETAMTLFNRTMLYNKHWIEPGHRSGVDKHNVSVTISAKENEWTEIGKAMWDNKDQYGGISLLPFDTGTYVQAPFEDCTKEQYEQMMSKVKEIDLTQVREEEDNTTRAEQLACASGFCAVD